MRLYRHKRLKKFLAALATLFISVFFCVAPNISPAYAQPSAEAILSKGTFGILKKINNSFYLVDQFGNIIDSVTSSQVVDLNKYVGQQILVKDNVFAGLAESPRKNENSFFSRLNWYLNHKSSQAAKPKSKPIPAPIYGITPVYPEPNPGPPIVSPPMPAPMYAVIFPKPGPVIRPEPKPIEPPHVIPIYAVYPPIEKPERIIKPEEPICKPLYAVEPPAKRKKPIKGPPYVHAIYAIEPPLIPAQLDEEVIERNKVVEQQVNQRAELRVKGIEISSNMAEQPKPFQGNKDK